MSKSSIGNLLPANCQLRTYKNDNDIGVYLIMNWKF